MPSKDRPQAQGQGNGRRATGPAFKATANQAALFVLDRVGEHASLSANTAAALDLTGPLDVELFCRVLQDVLARVETVHTRYFLQGGEVWAHELLDRLQHVERTDLSGLPEAEAVAALDGILRDVGRRRFDLVDGPVFRAHLVTLGVERHALVLATHHITFDGVSAGLFLGELAAAYEKCSRDERSRTLEVDAAFTPYSEVARAEHAARAAGAFEPAREEWTRYLEGLGEFPRLPGCAPAALRTDAPLREAATRPLAREQLFRLEVPGGPDDTWDSVARAIGVTPVTLALTAIALAWRLHTRVDDVAFFCTYANRKNAPGALGYLVNTLPLRLRCAPDATLAELAQQVRVGMKLAQRFADVPGAFVLQECLPPGLEPPFPFLNLIVNSPLFDPHEFPPFSLGPVAMTVNPRSPVIPPGGDVAVNVTFSGRTAAFHCIAHPFDPAAGGSEAAFALLCRHLGIALAAIAADPAQALSKVDWFAPGEEELVTRRFPLGPELTATGDATLSPSEGGDHLLVEGPDGSWTRAEVAGAAEAFADRRREAEAVVAVAGANSAASVAAILALWDAGCPWVFVPADAPEAVRGDIVARSGAKAVVGEPGPLALERWPLVRGPRSRPESVPRALPDGGLAYVVLTSGTTGTPVAVAVERGSLKAQVRALRQAWAFTAKPAQRYLLTARLSFDASLEALFLALATGGTVVVPEAATLTTPERFWGFVRSARIDVLSVTPSFLAAMGPPREALESVRAVVLGGEELPAGLAARLRAQLPRAVVLNSYGPTEATINTTSHGTADGRVVLGRPLPGFQCAVLDSQRRPVPLGVRGELAISGPCLARGYLSDAEASARRFVTLPGGKRAFLSGDEVSWSADGQLEFHGRRDAQVKIRGHRVDLKEIEQALRAHAAVRDATVVALSRGGRTSLAALVQPLGGARAEPAELRRSLALALPSSHVPEHLFVVPRLWHSPSGKVDTERAAREALSLLSSEQLAVDLTPAQARLATLWREVLGSAPSLDEDLFESGLDSLAVISLCAAAQHHGLTLSPEDLFQLRTLRRLAEVTREVSAADSAPHRPSVSAVDPAGPRVAIDRDRAVLLTGATGFLGIHVLDELLRSTADEVLCLVRAPGTAEAAARLEQVWDHYFPGQPLPSRVRALPGDLGHEQLGLSAQEFSALAARVGAVVHCAADVRWLGELRQLEQANVAGVRQVAAFCVAARAPLHHVSTVSLAFEGTRFLPYVASKSAGEQALRAVEGLDFAVYRVGMLVGRDRDGRFQRNAGDSGLRFLLASVALASAHDPAPCVTSLTPVDACARALVTLARSGVPRASTLNLFTPEPIDPRLLPGAESLTGDERSTLEQLTSLMDLKVLRRVLEAPETLRASEFLAAQGFRWPEASRDAVTRWLSEVLLRR
ncbi:MAG: AMP-binding protein [Myxococcaceae bacterium]|nr:AMP-binding protein [Myxococcaceae bacterium]